MNRPKLKHGDKVWLRDGSSYSRHTWPDGLIEVTFLGWTDADEFMADYKGKEYYCWLEELVEGPLQTKVVRTKGAPVGGKEFVQ